MPLPPVNATPEQIAALGWSKVAVWEKVDITTQGITYAKIQFDVSRIGMHGICTRCGKSDDVYLHTMPTGVYKTCIGAFCGVTTGPLPVDEDGKQIGEYIEGPRRIDKFKALDIINRTGAPNPFVRGQRR